MAGRPTLVFLAVSTTAALLGVCVAYNAFSGTSAAATSPLRRNNAIHRPRAQAPASPPESVGLDTPERPQPPHTHPVLSYTLPNEAAPLGLLVLRRPNSTHETSLILGSGALPSTAELVQMLGQVATEPDFKRDLHVYATQCILYAMLLARSPEEMAQMDRLGLRTMCEDLRGDGDLDDIRGQAGVIRDILSHEAAFDDLDQAMAAFEDVPFDHLDQGIAAFMESDAYIEHMAARERARATENEAAPAVNIEHIPEQSQGLKGLIYHIAESESKRKAYLHRGIHCEGCGTSPIRGIRYHCLNCPDYDLCSKCEANTAHYKTHVFARIKIPLPVLSQPTQKQPVWYTGDPKRLAYSLEADVKKHLMAEFDIDDDHMDANYDQFSCFANVPFPADPARIHAAIDFQAFKKCMTCERWARRLVPNFLYDRMFAFYDTNGDGLIGFCEFLSGLAYLRGPKRYQSLHRALQGYDIDGNGLLTREDFLRVLRAKLQVQRLLITDSMEVREELEVTHVIDTLRPSAPINSAMVDNNDIPQGQPRRPRQKTTGMFGDMRPEKGVRAVINDDEGWTDGDDTQGTQRRQQSQHNAARLTDLANRLDGAASESIAGPSSDRSAARDGDSSSGSSSPVIAALESTSNITDDAFDEDVIAAWAEEPFNEMLNALFASKEASDQEAIHSRSDRKKWQIEINLLRMFQKAAGATDPSRSDSAQHDRGRHDGDSSAMKLGIGQDGPHDQPFRDMNSAAESPHRRRGMSQPRGGIPPFFYNEWRDAYIPTRLRSRSMINLPRRAVDDLEDAFIAAAGATTAAVPAPTIAQLQTRDEEASLKRTIQFNFAGRPAQGSYPDEASPSLAQLKKYVRLEDEDGELSVRGGVGILNFEEIEAIVTAGRAELKGLVICWLELASF